ncbi:(Fe-S)-binding protein [Flavobacterium sp.]|uniref:(Fe-S)-binding protein n=1 Tax=Flavobacterium sp. TaxID=239 RepID=UPI00286DD5CC|nr:(Fe-S)-binding protein [Flavobacterium sp.]
MRCSFSNEQTYCGQTIANSGYENLGKGCGINFVANFSEFNYIVCPSGSCTKHVKKHFHDEKNEQFSSHMRSRVFKLTEFITDILKIKSHTGNFPYKMGLQASYHLQLGLKLSQMSELNAPFFSKPEQILSGLSGINLVSLFIFNFKKLVFESICINLRIIVKHSFFVLYTLFFRRAR